jgi:flavin reductase (DIM6/NTAB) family NADH-FMN oxidoreductase RutF
MGHVSIDPGQLEPRQRHKLTIGTVVPRPIAWTSSISIEGDVNLAPFSYYTAVHSYEPALAISVGSRDGVAKDTAANIAATGELVVNLVTEDLLERMIVTAAAFPSGIDELELAGLTPVASEVVRPPRVAESPVQIECQVMHTLRLGEPPRESALFVARIVRWHVRDDLLLEGDKIDQHQLDAVGRMGGTFYCRTDKPFSMRIPDWRDVLDREADATKS